MTCYSYTPKPPNDNDQLSPSETPTNEADAAELHWLAHGDALHYI